MDSYSALTINRSNRNTSYALGLIGICLIVFGAYNLFNSYWQGLPAWIRLSLVSLPVFFLYLSGILTCRFKRWKSYFPGIVLSAGLLLPPTLSYLFYHSGLYPYQDATLFFLSFLISLIWFTVAEFLINLSYYCLLTILASLGLSVTFVGILEASTYLYFVLGILLSYFYLSVGWFLDTTKKQSLFNNGIYTYTGTVIGWISLIFLPATLFNWSEPLITAAYFGISVIILLLAIFFSREYQKSKTSSSLFARQLFENTFPLTIILPPLLLDPEIGPSKGVLLLLAGIISYTFSRFILLESLAVLGIAAVVLGLLNLFILGITIGNASLATTIILGGLLLLGLALADFNRNIYTFLQKLSQKPKSPKSIFRELGASADQTQGPAVFNTAVWQFINRKSSNKWLALVFFAGLFSLIARLLGSMVN